MRRNRVTIGGLMAIVLVLAIGMAALKSPDETSAGVMFLMTCGVLMLAVIGALLRRGTERAWWLGFALFGWGYLLLAFGTSESWPRLPTRHLLESLAPASDFSPRFFGSSFQRPDLLPAFTQIGHGFWALGIAVVGGLMAVALFGFAEDPVERPASSVQPADEPPRVPWFRTTLLGLTGLVLATSTAAIGWRTAAGFWAGAVFLLTCSLLGVVTVGAVFFRGQQRRNGIGAAVFGAGYLIVAFGARPALDPMMSAIRPWLPPVPRSPIPENARILEALEQPVPMHFPSEIPFEDLLNYLKKATATPSYSGIPFHVIPREGGDERSLNPTVQIDLEGVPLKMTLQLCLEQLGLDYRVQDGLLQIAETVGEKDLSPTLDDPFRIVGHCLFALIAVMIGSLSARLIPPPERSRHA